MSTPFPDDLMRELVGQQVEVRSQSGSQEFRDDGVLEGCDGRWLKLSTSGGDLYFPVAKVRLVKRVG